MTDSVSFGFVWAALLLGVAGLISCAVYVADQVLFPVRPARRYPRRRDETARFWRRVALGVVLYGACVSSAFVLGQWHERASVVLCDGMGANVADVAQHEYPVYRMDCRDGRTVLYVD